MEVQHCQSIILNKTPYSDEDWIVNFLMETGEKMSGFARKARVSKNRFAGSLDLFNFVEVEYVRREGQMAQLRSVDLIQSMEGIRFHLEKFAACCYFAELISEFVQEQDEHPEVYTLFQSYIQDLNSSPDWSSQVIPVMQLKLMKLFGYKPNLLTCVDCQKDIDDKELYYFNGMKGAIVCETCYSKQSGEISLSTGKALHSYPLSFEAIQSLLEAESLDPSQWGLTKWPKQSIDQARHVFEYFVQYTAGKPFKSLQFLSKIVQ